jgi:hypothetical protein
MPEHRHLHAEPVSVSPSMLRLAVWQRLALASAVLVPLWAAVLWTLD